MEFFIGIGFVFFMMIVAIVLGIRNARRGRESKVKETKTTLPKVNQPSLEELELPPVMRKIMIAISGVFLVIWTAVVGFSIYLWTLASFESTYVKLGLGVWILLAVIAWGQSIYVLWRLITGRPLNKLMVRLMPRPMKNPYDMR